MNKSVFIEAPCLLCNKKELLPVLPNIEWILWPFKHKKCPTEEKR